MYPARHACDYVGDEGCVDLELLQEIRGRKSDDAERASGAARLCDWRRPPASTARRR